MVFRKIFCVFIILIVKRSLAGSLGFDMVDLKIEPICPNSPCRFFTPQQIIIGLWNLVGNLSPLMNEFRNTIISLLHVGIERDLALLLAETLWSVDKFTGFNPENVSTLSVYDSLVNQTIAINNGGDMTDLHEAIDAYGKLCQSAINFAIHVGLQAAGCPTKCPHPSPKNNSLNRPRCRTDCIKLFFKHYSTGIHERLQDIILRLSKSSNIIDQTVAVGCVAAATPSSVDFFEALLQRDELLEVLQLKACNLGIPPECCAARETELKSQCMRLSEATVETINALITDNADDDCLQSITIQDTSISISHTCHFEDK